MESTFIQKVIYSVTGRDFAGLLVRLLNFSFDLFHSHSYLKLL